jgi:hypothetical protein
MPFVLVKDVPGGEAPVLTSPVDDVVLPSQLVDFSFTDDFPGYAHLQVALDASFEEIVFETTHYSTATIIQAVMPYMQTAYFWRLIKPTGPIEKEASFTLYPNPATDQLFVAFTERELEFIDVFDITGRKVAQWNVKNVAGALSVDVSGFAPGVYIATSGGKGQKFIKR